MTVGARMRTLISSPTFTKGKWGEETGFCILLHSREWNEDVVFNKITHSLILPKSTFISLNTIPSNKAEQPILVKETYSVTAIQRVKESNMSQIMWNRIFWNILSVTMAY